MTLAKPSERCLAEPRLHPLRHRLHDQNRTNETTATGSHFPVRTNVDVIYRAIRVSSEE